MKKNHATLLFLASGILCGSDTFAQNLNNISTLTTRTANVPSFVTFNTNGIGTLKISESKKLLSSLLNLKNEDNLLQTSSTVDEIGYTHQRYQQYYKGVKVEHGTYIVHADINGTIAATNGEFYPINALEITPKLTEAQALQKALESVNAKQYVWEQKEEENFLKRETKNDAATYYPKGELVIVDDYALDGDNLSLAYKFDVYATNPVSRAYIYVDAQSGKILLSDAIIKGCIAHSAKVMEETFTANTASSIPSNYVAAVYAPTTDAAATGDSRYSGNLRFTADKSGSTYRLREVGGRGQGIKTMNANRGTQPGSATDFTDNDNSWTVAEHPSDDVAIDAHYGAEVVYDYWKTDHNRSSYDGAGTLLSSYVHWDNAVDNAYWQGSYMVYCDGKTLFYPLTAIDVCGHEIGHGVCSATAALVYQGESGAMNEGFSDIWGAVIEYWKFPNDPKKKRWQMGEEISRTGIPLRYMDTPNQKSQPDTYKGTYWATSSGDNGGVHTNSGVINYWFYLITEGGSGSNDKGDAFTVTSIGIKKAAQIAFRAESQYVTANTQYAGVRTAMISAATDLYGACSIETKTVTDAWYAVGVGTKYTGTTLPIPTITNASSVLTCNTTVTGATYQWYLNDVLIPGATASTYTITQNGKYTVTVKDANQCSASSAIFNMTNLGVNTIAGEASINLYPNPASATVNLFIHGKSQGKTTIELYDLTGRVIATQEGLINKGDNTFTLSIAGTAPGSYLVKVKMEDGSIAVKKLTVTK
jgi:bacillolysin